MNSQNQKKQESSKNSKSPIKNNKIVEKSNIKNKPGSDPVIDVGLPNTLTSVPIIHNRNHVDIIFECLPNLPLPNQILNDPRNTNTMNLLQKKIDICSTLCDFSDPSADVKAKAIKSLTLSELDFIFSNSAIVQRLPPQIVEKYFEMLMKNIMRDLPPVKKEYLIFDDEPSLVDINWPHLQLIYKQLLTFQQFHPEKVSKNVVSRMLTRIHAPDSEEREQVLIFFKLYASANPSQVTFLLKKFSFILQDYLNHNCYPFAVSPILKFYLLEFPLQCKEGQLLITIFATSILPLLSSQHILSFYGTLLQIMNFFITVDPSLTPQIIRRVMSYWPYSNPNKQVLFISLLTLLMENLSRSEFEKLAKPIFKLLSCYSSNSNTKVAEASLQIWSNIKIIPKILDNTRNIFPIAYPEYSRIVREHWNQETQAFAMNTLKSMHDLDPFLFEEITQTNKRNTQGFIQQAASTTTINAINPNLAGPYINGMNRIPQNLYDPNLNPRDDEENSNRNWALIARSAAKTDRSVNLAKTLNSIQKQFNNKPQNDFNMNKNGTFRRIGPNLSGRIAQPQPSLMSLNMRH